MDVARVASSANDIARSASTSANAAREGSAIHRSVGNAVDGSLSSSANNYLRGANGASGRQPDLTWGAAPGVWADLTTPGQWGSHVRRYGSQFGDGIPLLYERGLGLVDTWRLRSGAGTALSGTQALTSLK